MRKYFVFLILLSSVNFLVADQTTGTTMSGFSLVEKRFVKEVDAECLLFRHNTSGARLLKIANDDPNKTFCISFKT